MKHLEISKIGGYKFPALVHVVDANGSAVTDATVALALYNASNTAQRFDWSDKTFKTSGWTTASLALTHVASGVYFALGDYNQGSGVIAFADGQYLVAIPTITPATGPAVPGEAVVWQCGQVEAASMRAVNRQQVRKTGSAWFDDVYDNQGVVQLSHALKGPNGTTDITDVAATDVGYRAKGT